MYSRPSTHDMPGGHTPKNAPWGFSSVIDASKLFHMFLTMDEERQFMGLIHPDTGDLYWYAHFPMGS
jgi:hypothetical protein